MASEEIKEVIKGMTDSLLKAKEYSSRFSSILARDGSYSDEQRQIERYVYEDRERLFSSLDGLTESMETIRTIFGIEDDYL